MEIKQCLCLLGTNDAFPRRDVTFYGAGDQAPVAYLRKSPPGSSEFSASGGSSLNRTCIGLFGVVDIGRLSDLFFYLLLT